MKILFTILLLFGVAKAQIIVVGTIDEMRQIGAEYVECDSSRLDTVPLFFHVTDTIYYYDYFKANGVAAWRKVKGYDPALIPAGGYAVQGTRVNPKPYIMNGYGVFKTKRDCNREIFRRLDLSYKDIHNRRIDHSILPRAK